MTENEAIENLQDMYDVASCRIKNGDARGVIYIPPDKMDSFIVAITALKELQHYQMIKGVTIGEIAETLGEYAKIGTVEECREAVEKQKPIKSEDYDENLLYFVCPSCRCTIIADEFLDHKYCLNCGQAISWEESEKE